MALGHCLKMCLSGKGNMMKGDDMMPGWVKMNGFPNISYISDNFTMSNSINVLGKKDMMPGKEGGKLKMGTVHARVNAINL